MSPCPFCDKSIIKLQILKETESCLAILPLHPRCAGHILVIPKYHAQTILDLPNEFFEPVFSLVKEMQSFAKNYYKANGFNLLVNQEAIAGQTVMHFHIHIIPRYNAEPFNPLMSIDVGQNALKLSDIAKEVEKIKQSDYLKDMS